MPSTVIGIMGPDHGPEKLFAASEELGKLIASEGWLLLTGGRSRGVMDAACRGAKAAGGTTIGILPTNDVSEASEFIDIPIVTGMGSARDNINALSSAAIVAIGMGPGTAAEVALALKAQKPVVLMDAGDEAATFFKSLSADVATADTPEAVITVIKKLLNKA